MNPQAHHIEVSTPKAAAQAFLNCGTFDEHGKFGWDFTMLPADCVPWLQDLPIDGFRALQRCAQETALGTGWLALPDTFTVNQDMVVKLAVLAPLRTLNMPSPSLYMDLRGLQGGRIEFDTLLIRNQKGKLRLRRFGQANLANGRSAARRRSNLVTYIGLEQCPAWIAKRTGSSF